jgi:ABC-type uncharacterized transport system permease subunit
VNSVHRTAVICTLICAIAVVLLFGFATKIATDNNHKNQTIVTTCINHNGTMINDICVLPK